MSVLSRIFLSCIIAAFTLSHAKAADYQWAVDMPAAKSSETNAAPRAYLWIPPNANRVRAIVISLQNMLEGPLFENKEFRSLMAKQNVALLWIAPPAWSWSGFEKNDHVCLEQTLQSLAVLSGYDTLLSAPLIPIGHSMMAEMPYIMAGKIPHRILAGISLKGAFPNKQNWVDEFGKSGVPLLWISGEYEWAQERAKAAQDFRKKYPEAPFTMLAVNGGGHFDLTPVLMKYIAVYISKALEYPKHPINAEKFGVKSASWRSTSNETFWCFDEAHKKATEFIQAAGKKCFLLGYKQKGEIVPQNKDAHQQVTLSWLPENDDLEFSLEGAFLDTVPAGRPEKWVSAKAGSTVSHPKSSNKIIIKPINGPVEKIGNNRFAIRFNRVGFDNQKRGSEIWFQCEHEGDKDYQRAVQQAMMHFPLWNQKGTTQKITFDKIPDQVAGKNESIPLHATSDSNMKVRFYVSEGPAEIVGDTLHFMPIPQKAKLPITITVVAWQWGRDREPFVQTAQPVTQSFLVTQANAAAPENIKIEATLGSTATGVTIPPYFAGLSREWRTFPTPTEQDKNRVHPTYLQLLKNLNGISYRIGGASADNMENPPSINRWQQLAEVYQTTKTPMILTVNLANNDINLTKRWIQDAKANLPKDAIIGFELGNEPDGWFGKHKPKDYKWESYFEEFAAMRKQLVPSEIPSVIGPSWAHGLPSDIADIMLTKNPNALSMLTGHAYSFSPTVGTETFRLLRDDTIQKSVEFLAPAVAVAKKAKISFRLDEAGSAWGGGALGFSDTFAAALWILDFQTALAQSGLGGVNFHSGGKSNYSIIQDDSHDSQSTPTWIRVMPTYYGILAFQEFSNNSATFLPITITGNNSNTKIYAVKNAAGTQKILIIHKDLTKPATITFHTDKNGNATVKRLVAPAIALRDHVTWAGQTYDGSTDGKPLGKETIEPLEIQLNRFTIQAAPASALLISIP